jgi:hypothetical protein
LPATRNAHLAIGLRVRCPPLPPHPPWPPGTPGIEVRYRVHVEAGTFDCNAGALRVGELVSVWHNGHMDRMSPPGCAAEFVTTEHWGAIPPDHPLQQLRPAR